MAPLPVAIPLPPRPAPGVRSVLFALVLSALVACAGFLLVSRSTGVRVTGAAIAGPGQNVMTLITTDTFGYVKQNIDKLVQQAGVVISDIEETVNDRARLMREAEEREAVIDRLNAENDELRAKVDALTRLLSDIRRAAKVETV